MKKNSETKEKIFPEVTLLASEFKKFSKANSEEAVSTFQKEFLSIIKYFSCIDKKISQTDWNTKKQELVDELAQLITDEKITKKAIFSILELLPMELIEKLYDKLIEDNLNESFLNQILSYICELNHSPLIPEEATIETIKAVNTNIQNLHPETKKTTKKVKFDSTPPLRFEESVYLTKAYNLIKLGNYTEALALLEPFLTMPNPRYQENLSILGKVFMCYKGLGDVEKALKLVKKILKLEPNNIRMLVQFSNLEKKLGNYREVIRIQLRIRELEPNGIGALIEISNIYRTLRNYPEAVKIELQILEMDPCNLKSLKVLSDTYLKLGFHEERRKIEERRKQLIGDKVNKDQKNIYQMSF